MSKQHVAAGGVPSAAIKYLPQLRTMSGQGAVVSDYIDGLALGHNQRFLHHSPTWTNDKSIIVPVTERRQALVVILSCLWGSASRQRDLLAKRRDRDQVPFVSIAVTWDDRRDLRLVCCGSRRA